MYDLLILKIQMCLVINIRNSILRMRIFMNFKKNPGHCKYTQVAQILEQTFTELFKDV